MRKRIKTTLLKHRWAVGAVLMLLGLNVLLVFYLFSSRGEIYPELNEVSAHSNSFQSLTDYFTEIASKKGAVYAFDVLARAPLPPDVDVHLLGHVVGDLLYEQQGAKGILSCTDNFRNACSHSIVIGTLLEKGPSSFSEIVDLCRQAPGGSGAYLMCFHGLGHGVLAYNGYEFPKAIDMCKNILTTQGGETSECVGGAVMEMIAGVHDREMWEAMAKKYFKKEDPLYPCSGSFVPGDLKGICYTYLTPHLFKTAGANLTRPDPIFFEKAFSYCNPLSGELRKTCIGGFGKEFVVLAQNRDIRAIDQMSDAQFNKVIDWCLMAQTEEDEGVCVAAGMNSVLWGGENDPAAAVRYCVLAEEKSRGEECFNVLAWALDRYIKDDRLHKDLCGAFPEKYSNRCISAL